MAARSQLVGYNDNLEHRGQIYHVQTEDSGARRPNVVTHLFADGGRIVTTTKTSYAELVGEPDQETQVRGLMRTQHRAMMASLLGGELDHLLAAGATAAADAGGARAAASGAAPRASDRGQSKAGGEQSKAGGEATEGAAASVDMLEQAAASAAVGFLKGIRPSPPRPGPPPAGAGRKATPPGAGSYRFVGKNTATVPTPPAGGPPAMPPPRKRRYPQTNPGRLRADARGSAGQGAGDGTAGGTESGGGGPLPLPAHFGARFVTERSLDEVMFELLVKLDQG